ncbi:hypothetical protein AB0284_21685 [Pseudarthrobacter phenanthrenivorans]|uniref:hypothetical protein n=1 Tax=Micrococcaceae TaxID=1268 RepID=UPI0012F03C8E|nr:hypothetical protein [Micrococcus sp. 116]VWX45493.1 conserved hypothetical protein [Micrococcus sp. 116]
MTDTPTAVFTVRHRKALVEVITAALTHTQLDTLTAEHPVPGDPGHDAGKEGRVELIVLTYLEEPDQSLLIQALTLIDPDTLTGQDRKSWDMLVRRLHNKGMTLPTSASADVQSEEGEAGEEVAAADAPAAADPAGEEPARKRRGRRSRKAAVPAMSPGEGEEDAPEPAAEWVRAVPQLVAVGGAAALVAQLEALEGVEVVHVEDAGTRGQALAVLAAVSAALQTPGAVVAIGGPAEMMARLSVRG